MKKCSNNFLLQIKISWYKCILEIILLIRIVNDIFSNKDFSPYRANKIFGDIYFIFLSLSKVNEIKTESIIKFMRY